MDPNQFDILKNSTLVYYIDTNMLIKFRDLEVASTVYSLIRHMEAGKWENNTMKIQEPAISVQFNGLGNIAIPSEAKDKCS